MVEEGKPAPGLRADERRGRAGEARPTSAASRSSSTSIPRTTRPAARRRPAGSATTGRPSRARRRRARRQPRRRGLTREVQGEVRAAVHAPRRPRAPGRRGLRRLGREEVYGKTYMGVERSTFLIDSRATSPRSCAGQAGHARRAGGAPAQAGAARGPPPRWSPRVSAAPRQPRPRPGRSRATAAPSGDVCYGVVKRGGVIRFEINGGSVLRALHALCQVAPGGSAAGRSRCSAAVPRPGTAPCASGRRSRPAGAASTAPRGGSERPRSGRHCGSGSERLLAELRHDDAAIRSTGRSTSRRRGRRRTSRRCP